jgi:hypothetical protein
MARTGCEAEKPPAGRLFSLWALSLRDDTPQAELSGVRTG